MANIWVLGMLLLTSLTMVAHKGGVIVVVATSGNSTCGFPAIYNFGDDNSDTGEHAEAFDDLALPNGQTFFGKSSGRYCDGRLIIDFIAEHLGFPFLSPYMDSYASNFSHGANFAMGGHPLSGICNFVPATPFNLEKQVNQFSQFKSRTTALYNDNLKEASFKSIIPRPEDFSKALYIFDIGHNDLFKVMDWFTTESAQNAVPSTLNQFSRMITILHDWEGVKFFWIHNVGPLGCLPSMVKSCQKGNRKCVLDHNGCAKDQNDVVQEYNKQLKDNVNLFRTRFPDASFTYVDMYSAKYNLISQAKSLGFDDPMKPCCDNIINNVYVCGVKNPDGAVKGNTACKNPERYISWDGIHFSEKANQYVAKLIINGTYSDPPLSLPQACRRS